MFVSKKLSFVCSKEELSGVKKISKKVIEDFNKVFQFEPEFIEVETVTQINDKDTNPKVIFGTLNNSEFVTELAKNYKIPTEEISGKREVYIFKVIENQLFIFGSDKRGSIYGLFHLSEMIGVSPLVDWCGILPSHKDSFEFSEKDNLISKEPSVKFRGFFINDEWPAFGNWSRENFGGFNAKMYEHVFELLLRLKGNYLWPAMWSSQFSLDGPGLENAILADELGVVMGASHHEPCCRAGEEYRHVRGPQSIYGDAWNFRSNEKGITKFWEDGLKRNGKFENVITVGMRGEADTAIMQNATLADNIELLRDVIKTQNALIKEHVNSDLNKVPRMLALYKEVEPYFYGDENTPGLIGSSELEGVTLMLCDDNHGNLRTLPTEAMRNHNGGYGMYYHFDYHGSPFSYEWFNTTHLAKVKEQMTTAYEFGIQDLWIVNVGDVLTNEFPLSYFLNLAYDYEKYSNLENTVEKYTKEWISFQFPYLNEEQKEKTYQIINGYTRLAHKRRTEALQTDTYHPINYNESNQTLLQAENIIQLCMELKSQIEDKNWQGFFTQVYLPACGNMNILRMQLYSGKNHWLAKKGIVAASWYAEKVKSCYEFDKNLVAECDSVANGKWIAMGWSEHFGFKHWCEAENKYPVYMTVEPCRKKRIAAWIEGDEFTTSGQDWTKRTLILDCFKNPNCNEAVVNYGFCCKEEFDLEISIGQGNDGWLSVNKKQEESIIQPKEIVSLIINIDREKLAHAEEKKDIIKISGNDGHGARILVEILVDAILMEMNYEQGTFVQTTDYISIEAEHYKSKKENGSSKWEVLPEYGKTLSAVKVFPVTSIFADKNAAPEIEYDFVLNAEGKYNISFYTNPSNPVAKDNKLQFGVELNGKYVVVDAVPKTFSVGDNQEPWGTDVTNNIRIVTISEDCKKGLNKLILTPITPGFVLEKIVICDKLTLKSYLGAPETYKI